ncbi:MAG: class I SAM-dependent methyltransferase [Deltaproteobacteria bacterium]|nr:class I SAM-dependent methyltransferase [Deltaproteobacteria bacterium]
MIPPPFLPAEFVVWNATTGASHSGPFGSYRFCPSTRVWEYPWAYHVAPVRPGMRVMDVGGALCGFSLALARAGAEVTVVDPDVHLQSPREWLDRLTAQWAVRVASFRGEVAALPEPDGSFDVAYCLSVIEHIPGVAERRSLVEGVHRKLRRGGLFVVSIDVDFRFEPFTTEPGRPELRNVSVAELLSHAPFRLAFGNPSELLGMPGFDAGAVLSRSKAGDFLVDSNRLSTQCFVLQAT